MKSAVEIDKDEIASLIRGEKSAVETYNQVLRKYCDDPQMDDLRHFSADHIHAVEALIEGAKTYGVKTPESSGAWGSWAKLVSGSAKAMGKTSALKALKEGEEHGLKEYESALEEENIPKQMKDEIRTKFIPKQREHIRRIDSLMERI